jgi:hypothetical protein
VNGNTKAREPDGITGLRSTRFRLPHPAAHAVMVMVVVTHLVRMRFREGRDENSTRDGGERQNFCCEFHYFFLC